MINQSNPNDDNTDDVLDILLGVNGFFDFFEKNTDLFDPEKYPGWVPLGAEPCMRATYHMTRDRKLILERGWSAIGRPPEEEV